MTSEHAPQPDHETERPADAALPSDTAESELAQDPKNPFNRFAQRPGERGLYRPDQERDACGLAVISTLRGTPGHDIVEHALTALRNLEHRGAVGADEGTGDGAGLLTQVPDEFFRAVLAFELPAPGDYAVGTAFLPDEDAEAAECVAGVEELAHVQGLTVLGWREVPVDASVIGRSARDCMPRFVQLFLSVSDLDDGLGSLDARAFRLRKRAQNRLGVYFPSLSSRTIVYKGMLTTAQVEPFYPGPVRSALRHAPGDRAFSVLHEHLPVLAAGPAVPDGGAQR